MKDIKIREVFIGESRPVAIIAEVACEHGGDLNQAKRLIRAAKASGADMVKFQLHVPEAEMVPDRIRFWAGSMDAILKKVNFGTKEQHEELMEYCDEIGIQYLCTPFCVEAVDMLADIGVPAYKTGSGELSNLPMLRHIAKKGKPMIVSTGMSTLEEIKDTVAVLTEENANFMLMNCTSEYPASYENANLKLIPLLRDKFGVMVGQSDHTTEFYTAIAAVALGARALEKHLTIRDLHGPDDIVSLDPAQFKEMVRAVRCIEKALGKERRLWEGERAVREWAHHSVVVARQIENGETITLGNVTAKRPGTGIAAKYLDPLFSAELLGRKAKTNLPKNHILQWRDIV